MAWEIFEDCIKVESPWSMPFLREFSWRMDETDRYCTDCKVPSTDANVALDTSKMVDYLENATTIYVTGFVKVDPNHTETEIHFIAEH